MKSMDRHAAIGRRLRPPSAGSTGAAPTVSAAAGAGRRPHDFNTARQAARQAARRARLASEAGDRPAFAASANVLVCDADPAASDSLCELLEALGFCTYPARDTPQARWMAETQNFAAAFVDLSFGGDVPDGLPDLRERLKKAAERNGAPLALIILCSVERPSDRVRALMVGADAAVTKPASRGRVARALEDCCVALPADPRRS